MPARLPEADHPCLLSGKCAQKAPLLRAIADQPTQYMILKPSDRLKLWFGWIGGAEEWDLNKYLIGKRCLAISWCPMTYEDKNCNRLINICCQAMCHQSWLAVWRNVKRIASEGPLLKEAASIPIVLLSYSISPRILSLKGYRANILVIHLSQNGLILMCLWPNQPASCWKLFWDSNQLLRQKAFLGQISQWVRLWYATWLLRGVGWDVWAIRWFVSNPKPTTWPFATKALNSTIGFNPGKDFLAIKNFLNHVQHNITSLSWIGSLPYAI